MQNKKPVDLDNINYSEMVKALAKDGQEIIDSLTPEKAHIWHMGTGVVGEAGELIDAVKKQVIYNKEADIVNVIEEIGDIEFYLEGLRQAYGITREQTILHNKAKLAIRYEGGQYSDKAATMRADKKDVEE